MRPGGMTNPRFFRHSACTLAVQFANASNLGFYHEVLDGCELLRPTEVRQFRRRFEPSLAHLSHITHLHPTRHPPCEVPAVAFLTSGWGWAAFMGDHLATYYAALHVATHTACPPLTPHAHRVPVGADWCLQFDVASDPRHFSKLRSSSGTSKSWPTPPPPTSRQSTARPSGGRAKRGSRSSKRWCGCRSPG